MDHLSFFDVHPVRENVAQIFNLLYRRLAACWPHDLEVFGNSGRDFRSDALPITNRRYGRLKICATPAQAPRPGGDQCKTSAAPVTTSTIGDPASDTGSPRRGDRR